MNRLHIIDTVTGEVLREIPARPRVYRPRVYRSPTAQVERDVRLATTLVMVLVGILILV